MENLIVFLFCILTRVEIINGNNVFNLKDNFMFFGVYFYFFILFNV